MRGNSSGCQVLSHQEWGPRGPRRGWSELHGWVPEEEMLRGPSRMSRHLARRARRLRHPCSRERTEKPKLLRPPGKYPVSPISFI